MRRLFRQGLASVFSKAAGMWHRIFSFMVYHVARGLPAMFYRLFSKNKPGRKICLKAQAIKYGRKPEKFKARFLGQALEFNHGAIHGEALEPVFDSGHIIAATINFKNIDSFKGQKVAVMAHFDLDGLFDPYLWPYLRHLHEIGFRLIVVSAGGVALADEIKGLLSACITRSEKGYDFTSWRAAFQCFPDLFEAEELVLCNDSVLAPLNSFQPIHELMDSRNFDFWGLCENREIVPHIQSYYLVFKRGAVSSPRFRKFFSSIVSRDRAEAIKTEIGLTRFLAREGLNPGAYISAACLPVAEVSPIDYYWPVLIDRFGFPCFKKNLLLGNAPWLRVNGWRKLFQEKNYSLKLVDDYQARVGKRLKARFAATFAQRLKDRIFDRGITNQFSQA
jgi:rhamnosyltransferase